MKEEALEGPKPRMRRVKSATKDTALLRERRAALIAAAVTVFMEKGFHETTVREIGRAAGMTQGSIYNYVESKDDILYLVCDHIVSEYQDETRKALENSPDPVQRVSSAVRAVSEVMYKHQESILLIYQDSHMLDSKSRRVILARVEEFIGMFESILTEAARASGMAVPNPHFVANILTFLPTMIALRRWSLKGDTQRESLISGLVDFLTRGLGFETSPVSAKVG